MRLFLLLGSYTIKRLTLSHSQIDIETRIDVISYSHPEKLEAILEEISETLHENHYLITDTKRRLIDIYGVEKGFHYSSIDRMKVGWFDLSIS